MNVRSLYLIVVLFSFFHISCVDQVMEDMDNSNNNIIIGEREEEVQSVQEWIYTTLSKYYLWNDELPALDQINLQEDPDKLFYSLLSGKDGKAYSSNKYNYSYIQYSSATKGYQGNSPSLGFEYTVFADGNGYILRVLYVLPDSPAQSAGIKRGDWIKSINDNKISTHYSTLLSGGSVKLGISESYLKDIAYTVELSPAMVVDNPVYLDTIYEVNGKKIAYLVYNHFTMGTEGYQNEIFNNSLRNAFTKFKVERPDEFVLDLRYNSGGYLSCGQLLTGMLVPNYALNNIYCKKIFNKDREGENADVGFVPRLEDIERNLNLSRIVILTSNRTASVSETVINGLIPYMGKENVILIGEQTEGKNVGAVTYTNRDGSCAITPIVCYLGNKNGEFDFENGFEPDILCPEPLLERYELGDPNEALLRKAFEYISGGTSLGTRSAFIENPSIPLLMKGSSLDSKKRGAILLDDIL